MAEYEDYLIKIAVEFINQKFDNIFKKTVSFGNDVHNEILIKTKKAFEEYYKTSINKYVQTKTILYRETPVNLYDFYVNVDLEDNKKKIINTNKIDNLTSKSKNILITGTAGCGKSTLIKHLFLNTIKGQRHIPIFIELKNIDTEKALIDSIYENLSNLNFNLEKEYFEKLLESGEFILFFDGFDEIEEKNTDKIERELLKLKDKYYKNNFIITSRPENRYISWSTFVELKVLPLSKEKSLELIDKIDYDQKIKKEFYNELNVNLYDMHESFASNPLLLILMLMTFREYADIPDKIHLFYSMAFETLFIKHDATKTGYKRIHYTNLEIDDFKKILSFFCLYTYLKNKITFTKEEALGYLKSSKKITNLDFDENNFFCDLTKTICVLIPDGIKYTFTHRTFQEYFSALCIVHVNSKLRKKLLEKLENKKNFDIAMRLVFEIDREKFEEDYLIDKLKKIKKETKWGSISKDESLVYYYKNYINTFYLINDSSWTVGFYNGVSVMTFINYNYVNIYEFQKNHFSSGELFPYRNRICFSKELKKLLNQYNYPIHVVFSKNEDNEKVFKLFAKYGIHSFQYKCSMYVLDKIIAEHKKTEKSIEEILNI